MSIRSKTPVDSKKKSYVKELLLLFFLGCIFLAYSSIPVSTTISRLPSPKTPKAIPQQLQQPICIEMIGNVPVRDQIQTIEYSQQAPSFTLLWGEGSDGIGLKGYDPSACNGISSGALPTQLQAMEDDTLWIADGYGPRLVRVSSRGEIIDEIPLPELRRPEISQIPALVGFTFHIAEDQILYVMDTAQKRILYYSMEGEFRGSFDIGFVFYNPERLLQVDPFFSVLPGPIFRIQIHMKANENRLLSEIEEFATKDVATTSVQGFYDVPIQPSTHIGLYVNKVARIISIFDPSQEEAFFSHGSEVKFCAPPTNFSSEEMSFQLQQTRYKTMSPTSITTISLFEPQWEGGGCLGCDKNGAIYYWVDSHTIGIIEPLHQQNPEMKVRYMKIPKGFMHPVAVLPGGGIVGMRTEKELIEVYRFIAET